MKYHYWQIDAPSIPADPYRHDVEADEELTWEQRLSRALDEFRAHCNAGAKTAELEDMLCAIEELDIHCERQSSRKKGTA